MCIETENVLRVVNRIAEREGFISFEHYLSAGSKKGDNFVGEIIRVRINGKKSDGKEENLSFILKCTVANEARREHFMNDVLFEREVYFYQTVLPKFNAFQRECGLGVDSIFSSYPKCHDAEFDSETGEYIIVLEDLCAQDFELWPKEQPNSFENILLVVRALARLHAVSFAMKDQQPEIFEEYKKLTDLLQLFSKDENRTKMFDIGLKNAIDLMDNPEHIKIYTHVVNNLQRYIENLMEVNDDRIGVLGHGDCHNNNIMYHKTNLTKSDDVRLLDYQVVRYCSPALDLVYYLFGSTDKKLRSKYYNDIIKIYYQQLALNVRSMGSDPDKLFTYDDLQSELKRCGNLAIVMAPMQILLYLAKGEDMLDLDKFSETGGSVNIIQNADEHYKMVCKERVCDVINDLIDLGYYHQVD